MWIRCTPICKRVMRAVLILAIMGAFLGAAVTARVFWLEHQIGKIQPGLSDVEVKNLLGEPAYGSERGSRTWLYFPFLRPSVSIDFDPHGRVIRVRRDAAVRVPGMRYEITM